jgi:hypothetical protein
VRASRRLLLNRARGGHAGPESGQVRARAIMPERAAELGIRELERVTRIELALSAWESVLNLPVRLLACGCH